MKKKSKKIIDLIQGTNQSKEWNFFIFENKNKKGVDMVESVDVMDLIQLSFSWKIYQVLVFKFKET